jgi:hypothetical protein
MTTTLTQVDPPPPSPTLGGVAVVLVAPFLRAAIEAAVEVERTAAAAGVDLTRLGRHIGVDLYARPLFASTGSATRSSPRTHARSVTRERERTRLPACLRKGAPPIRLCRPGRLRRRRSGGGRHNGTASVRNPVAHGDTTTEGKHDPHEQP